MAGTNHTPGVTTGKPIALRLEVNGFTVMVDELVIDGPPDALALLTQIGKGLIARLCGLARPAAPDIPPGSKAEDDRPPQPPAAAAATSPPPDAHQPAAHRRPAGGWKP